MEDVKIPKKLLRDGFIETSEGMFSRDPERTPMQWDTSAHAGFSTANPWLPVAKNYKKVNVETQSKDEQSMLTLYKTLINFRNQSDTLVTGAYRSIDATSADVFAYIRASETEKLLVMINFSDQKIVEPLPPGDFEMICSSLLDIPAGEKFSGKFTLRPNEACLFKYV
jgi:alpha-glucosidase